MEKLHNSISSVELKQEINFVKNNVRYSNKREVLYRKNDNTGELEPVEVFGQKRICFTQEQYYKTGALQILNALDLIGNKPIEILTWMIKNMNSQNMIFATVDQICNAVRNKENGKPASRSTVSILLNQLIQAGYLRRLRIGQYILAPDLIMKGSESKKQSMLIEWSLDKKELDTQQLSGESLINQYLEFNQQAKLENGIPMVFNKATGKWVAVSEKTMKSYIEYKSKPK